MSLRRTLIRLAAPAALLVLAACATSFKADVARFQTMPAPEGQTFTVQAADPRLQGGLEFQQYAQLVTARLAALGYRPAEGPNATMVVTLDYGVDNGHEKIVTTPGFGAYGPAFGTPWGYGGFGPGPVIRTRRGRYIVGWADPFWYRPWGYPEVESYTYFVSRLDMAIRRASDGRVLFEGHARARSLDNKLTYLVPNLVEAMFTGFPGRSGEQVLITVPPPPKSGPAPVNR